MQKEIHSSKNKIRCSSPGHLPWNGFIYQRMKFFAVYHGYLISIFIQARLNWYHTLHPRIPKMTGWEFIQARII